MNRRGYGGAWLNAAVPDDISAQIDGLKLDHREFFNWLADQLAEFRFHRDIKKGTSTSLPWRSQSEELAIIDRYISALESVANFPFNALPPRVSARMTVEAFRREIAIKETASRMQGDAGKRCD